MFYVYVLHSLQDSGLYIGYSTDLRRRLGEHKPGAARATSYRGPWKLIYYEAYVEKAASGRDVISKAAPAGDSEGPAKHLFLEPARCVGPRELRRLRRSCLRG